MEASLRSQDQDRNADHASPSSQLRLQGRRAACSALVLLPVRSQAHEAQDPGQLHGYEDQAGTSKYTSKSTATRPRLRVKTTAVRLRCFLCLSSRHFPVSNAPSFIFALTDPASQNPGGSSCKAAFSSFYVKARFQTIP